ncbi:MAG: hypothetical protein ACR2G5_10435, partial [Pyrinomonadaceae bacterium]
MKDVIECPDPLATANGSVCVYIMAVKETLSELVAIDSVSSRSNIEIATYLTVRCEALGLKVKRFPYLEEKGVEKINLVALCGTN